MAWIVLASFIILLFVTTYVFLGPVIGNIILLLSLTGTAIWLLYQRATVHLDEMTAGVIFDRHGNFSRFLDSGHHYIDPFREHLEATLSKGNHDASDRAENLRTKEGIPITIKWSVSAKINFRDIKPGLEHKMARVLPQYSSNVLAGKTVHALRHIVEQKSIRNLHSADSIKKLEDEVRREVYRRSQALGFQEILPSDIKLGPIEVPSEVEEALETDYVRRLETETTVGALERLRDVVGEMDDEIMERLNELERLRIVGRGDTHYYMMDSGASSRRRKQGDNGPNGPEPETPGPPLPPGTG